MENTNNIMNRIIKQLEKDEEPLSELQTETIHQELNKLNKQDQIKQMKNYICLTKYIIGGFWFPPFYNHLNKLNNWEVIQKWNKQ